MSIERIAEIAMKQRRAESLRAAEFIKAHMSERERDALRSIMRHFDAEAIVGSPVTQERVGRIPRPSEAKP